MPAAPIMGFSFFAEQVNQLREQHAADRIENKGNKAKQQNQKRLRGLKNASACILAATVMPRAVSARLARTFLSGFGKGVQNAAFAQKITKHQEAHERPPRGRQCPQ